MMLIIKGLGKILGYLIAGCIAIFVIVGFYNNTLTDRALVAHTNASDWRWQNDRGWWWQNESDTQWRVTDKGSYPLRRVYSDSVVQAYLRQTEDEIWELVGQALFAADCSVGKSVATEATYSDGEPIKFTCIEAYGRTYIFTSVVWSDVDLDNLPSWTEDLSGFTVDEHFSSYLIWDFGPARRHLTLSQLKD